MEIILSNYSGGKKVYGEIVIQLIIGCPQSFDSGPALSGTTGALRGAGFLWAGGDLSERPD